MIFFSSFLETLLLLSIRHKISVPVFAHNVKFEDNIVLIPYLIYLQRVMLLYRGISGDTLGDIKKNLKILQKITI